MRLLIAFLWIFNAVAMAGSVEQQSRQPPQTAQNVCQELQKLKSFELAGWKLEPKNMCVMSVVSSPPKSSNAVDIFMTGPTLTKGKDVIWFYLQILTFKTPEDARLELAHVKGGPDLKVFQSRNALLKMRYLSKEEVLSEEDATYRDMVQSVGKEQADRLAKSFHFGAARPLTFHPFPKTYLDQVNRIFTHVMNP